MGLAYHEIGKQLLSFAIYHIYCLAKELARRKKCLLSVTACLHACVPVCMVCPPSHVDMANSKELSIYICFGSII